MEKRLIQRSCYTNQPCRGGGLGQQRDTVDRNDETAGQKTPQLGLKYLGSLPVRPNYCHSAFIPHFLLQTPQLRPSLSGSRGRLARQV